VLLAAGAGRRFGGPKALVRVGGRSLVRRACDVLAAGGCSQVLVIVGSRADEVRAELLPGERAVYAAGWETGMGASLRAGLAAVSELDQPPAAALLHLVDLPDVSPTAVRRVAELAAPDVVARAGYSDVPGHPVLLGSQWWDEVAESLTGDRGAREWLRHRSDLRLVECGDLATGDDVDTPDELNSYACGRDDS